MKLSLAKIKQELWQYADPERAKASRWYFKTGKGEYGEGDKFIGLTSAEIKAVAKKYGAARFSVLEQLPAAKIHEERMLALRILVRQFIAAQKGEKKQRKAIPSTRQIYKFYLDHTGGVNNWDLVDTSAPYIVGLYLLDKPRGILYKLARSKNVWERRIAMMGTFAFIRFGNDYADALKLAELLLADKHDLIHKAVGWMLREVGNRSRQTEEKFLQKHYRTMPRTMLRYAIEKFPEALRRQYLKKVS